MLVMTAALPVAPGVHGLSVIDHPLNGVVPWHQRVNAGLGGSQRSPFVSLLKGKLYLISRSMPGVEEIKDQTSYSVAFLSLWNAMGRAISVQVFRQGL